MRNAKTLDDRELIPFDYKQMTAEQLRALKDNLFHSIVTTEDGLICSHREFNAVKLALREKERESQAVGQGEL